MNDYFLIITVLIFLSALFGYINVRFLKLPNSIGLMLITILFTFGVFLVSYFDSTLLNAEKYIIRHIDFKTVLLDVMLSFLLFAGALHTNFQQLKVQRWPVLVFSTFGVLLSTFLVGILMFYVLKVVGLQIEFIYCLLFGALISPTDPIAVLGILKQAGVPKKLEAKIVGESLFNDGVGVVVFLTLFQIASLGNGDIEAFDIVKLFGQEVLGGVALGAGLGWITYRLMRSIDDYDIEVIITLAAVMVGTVIAHKFHLSAPLAMVTAGLIIGNDTIRGSAMSKITESYVDKFWELIDILLNNILFVLIGIASGAFELARKYSKERKAFGTEICNHQAIAFKLADMATDIEAARHLVMKAAWEKDQGINYDYSSAMAKLYASKVAMEHTVEAVQIHGGNGFVKEYHVERLMRDAKITQIYEGTSEIQKIVISRSLLRD